MTEALFKWGAQL